MAAPAFGALQRGPGHGLAHQQHVAQVDGQMPARVVLAVPFHLQVGVPGAQLLQPRQRLRHFVGGADDPDQIVHALLQFNLQLVRILGW